MADLALNTTTGDLDITNNEFSLVSGDDDIVQHLSIRLKFFQGEWVLDTRLGMPYFQDILIKNPNLVVVRGIFREAILETPGVASIERFDMGFDNASRKLSIAFSVEKTDGEVLDFSEEFIIG